MTRSLPGAGPAAGLADFASVLSAVDLLRRRASSLGVPLAEVYLEGARGNLHHAREAMLRAGATGRTVPIDAGGGAFVEVDPARPLCAVDAPADWTDERMPACPDLGGDLFRSEEACGLAGGWYLGGMLAAALADHAWLHVASGVSWSTDRSGALAIVGAMSGGRPVAVLGCGETMGSLEEGVVRMIAGLGWRRLRSPRLERWEPGDAAAAA